MVGAIPVAALLIPSGCQGVLAKLWLFTGSVPAPAPTQFTQAVFL